MRQILRHGGNGEIARQLEFAAIGRERALQEREQGRFAATVPTDDTDLFAAQDAEGRGIDEGFRAAPQPNIAQVNHARDCTCMLVARSNQGPLLIDEPKPAT